MKKGAEIAPRVEQIFASVDQIEQRVKGDQARVNHLTPSILAKTFRCVLAAESESKFRREFDRVVVGED